MKVSVTLLALLACPMVALGSTDAEVTHTTPPTARPSTPTPPATTVYRWHKTAPPHTHNNNGSPSPLFVPAAAWNPVIKPRNNEEDRDKSSLAPSTTMGSSSHSGSVASRGSTDDDDETIKFPRRKVSASNGAATVSWILSVGVTVVWTLAM